VYLAVIGFGYAIKAMPQVRWIIPCMTVEFIDVLMLMVIIMKFNLPGGVVFLGFPSYFGHTSEDSTMQRDL